MKKELYVFRIGGQNRESGDQDKLRREIISLLEIAPVEFKLDSSSGDCKYKKVLVEQSFTFETQEETRQFALKILRTGVVFFCELKAVEVK